MKETNYIVSGYMRTGTSMMMKALIAGGIDAKYDNKREVMRKKHADDFYDPNYGGLYELDRSDYQDSNFPDAYKGKLIKCLGPGIAKMKPSEDIKMIFMRRDGEEIRQSYEAFFNAKHLLAKDLDIKIERFIAEAQNRKDISNLQIFWYRDVVENPRKYFEILKENGWDIDVDNAINVVNPEMCRFKKEKLTRGI